MSSIVISPFWQSVDEHWIGATLVAISLAGLFSTALFVARYRSVLFFSISSALVFLTAFLLAPIADARSPKMFQLWLMSPEALTGLSLAQLFFVFSAVFGSIRLEAGKTVSNRLSYKIRSWTIAGIAVIPSPVLLVFVFWLEQNMMIATREQVPWMIGLKIAFVLSSLVAAMSLALCLLDRYRLLTGHVFVGLFLLLSGALLPCLTTKLSVGVSQTSTYYPNSASVVLVLSTLLVVVLAGVVHRKRRLRS